MKQNFKIKRGVSFYRACIEQAEYGKSLAALVESRATKKKILKYTVEKQPSRLKKTKDQVIEEKNKDFDELIKMIKER